MHQSVLRRRREWSAGEKAKIVREVQRPGAMLQEVAQRHGLCCGGCKRRMDGQTDTVPS